MLLERDTQLASFAAWVADAAEGRGSLVLVEGEAGCGKSSLVRAAARACESWWGYCDPLTTPRPLGPLLDLAGVAGFPVPDDSFEAYDALLRELRSRSAPVVVVVEDVHWADEATLAMLQYLGRRVGGTHAVVAVTYRADEVGEGLRRVLGDLARHPETVRRVKVDLLSATAVRGLTAGSGLDPDEVHATTGGNAFFVSEVVAFGGGLPANVRDAVLARNARLSPETRAVVDLVSVEPGGLELALVDSPESANGVLVVHGNVVRFRHELARLATYDALPAPRRIELHRALLARLEGSADLARLAHHALGTADPSLVVTHALPAGRDAIKRGANRQALAFFEAVLPHEHELTLHDRAGLLLDLGDTLSRMDLQMRAYETLRGATEHAERIGDPALWALSLHTLARAAWRVGRTAEASDLEDRAVAVLRPLGATSELTEALRGRAQGLMLARHHLPALEAVHEAATVADEIGDEPASIRAELIEGTIELVTGDADRGIALLTSSLDRARGIEEQRIVSEALGMLGSGGGEARRYDEAFDWSSELVALAQDRDHDFQVAYARAWQARIRFEQGRWDEAAALAQLPTSDEVSAITRATSYGVLGRLRVRRGDPRPEEPLSEASRLEALELQHRWPALCGLAELHWLHGRPADGVEVLQAAYLQALETDSAWAQGELGFWLSRCGGIDVPPPRAAAPFAAHIAGDWQTAADLWERVGCPYERALALLDGDRDSAVGGLEILDRLGARPLAARARRQLAERGIAIPRAPRRTTLANPNGLTEREAQIHALVVQGLDNTTIAQRLYLSRRTVEHHVSSVLRKYGVASRAELET